MVLREGERAVALHGVKLDAARPERLRIDRATVLTQKRPLRAPARAAGGIRKARSHHETDKTRSRFLGKKYTTFFSLKRRFRALAGAARAASAATVASMSLRRSAPCSARKRPSVFKYHVSHAPVRYLTLSSSPRLQTRDCEKTHRESRGSFSLDGVLETGSRALILKPETKRAKRAAPIRTLCRTPLAALSLSL